MQDQQSHLITFSNSCRKRQQQTSRQTKTSFKQHSQIKDNIENNKSTKQQDHSLLYEILQKQKRKTIYHNINYIDTQSMILYRQPVNTIETINSTQLQLAEKSKKYDKNLNNLYYKIKHQFFSLKEINQKNIQNQQKKSIKHSISLKPKRSSSQSEFNENNKRGCQKRSQVNTSREQKLGTQKNRMISASGMTSYKFKSLRAQRNLIHNPFNNRSSQQLLSSSLQDIKFKSNCPINRKNLISYRSVGQKHRQAKQKQIAFKQNLLNAKDRELSTEIYLQKVGREKKNIEKVYGEEESKLTHISYLMKQMGFEREVAQFSTDYIVQKIREQFDRTNFNAEIHDQILPARKLTIERDEKELNCRRKIYYKPKRTKQLYKIKDSLKQTRQNKNYTRSAVLLNTFNFASDY